MRNHLLDAEIKKLYDKSYAEDEPWVYNKAWERQILSHFILSRLPSFPRIVIDVGCGTGLHASLLAEMCEHVVGADFSHTGIQKARNQSNAQSNLMYMCLDANELSKWFRPVFDLVLVRGLSSYHYCLADADVVSITKKLFALCKPGGCFCLMIATDLSGTDRPDGTCNNRLEDYLRVLTPFGHVLPVIDWEGNSIQADTKRAKIGLIVTVVKESK